MFHKRFDFELNKLEYFTHVELGYVQYLRMINLIKLIFNLINQNK